MTALAPLARLAPVSLPDLVAQAGLMTRTDRKYLLPQAAAEQFAARIDAGARVLEINGVRDFAYESWYFDTAEHHLFHLAACGRRRRFRVRTRAYADSGTAYLELKTKDGRGTTVKQRLAYPPAHVAELTAQGREYLAELLAQAGYEAGYVAAVVGALRPALVSRYRRATVLLPTGDRLTLDTALSWATGQGRTVALPGQVIIESKTARGASRAGAADKQLWQAGFRPRALSKFGTGTAALHPGLPRNRWSRLLREHFPQPSPPAISPAISQPGGQYLT